MLHLCKEYADGVGHIEQTETDGTFLVSFYGRRVVQETTTTLREARVRLRALANTANVAR
jgi:hypothetical protein